VLLSLVYRLLRCLLGLLAVLVRSDLSKDAELLVLRHENQVLRRQLSGRLRWDHAGRLWLTALSRLVSRRRWPRSSRSPQPRSCAGTVTSSPARGTTPAGVGQDGGPPVPRSRFLIHDRDPLFTTAFGGVFKAEGLQVITTLPRTPRMNAICERVIGTLRRELLDRTLILSERHLALVLREYVIHYDGHRPHQSRQQRPPDIETQPARDVVDLRSVRRKPVVAGVINEYHHAA
jgi:transposase InsO family protein